MHFEQVQGQLVRVTNVTPQKMSLHFLLTKVVGGRHKGFLVEIRTDEHDRMRVQVLSPEGVVADEGLQVQKQRAVSTSHVAQPQRLLCQRSIEHLLDNRVEVTEVSLVRTARAPDVEGAIHMDLRFSRFGAPQPAAFAQQSSLAHKNVWVYDVVTPYAAARCR